MLFDPNDNLAPLHRPLSRMLLLNVLHHLLDDVVPNRHLLLPWFHYKNLLNFLVLPLGVGK